MAGTTPLFADTHLDAHTLANHFLQTIKLNTQDELMGVLHVGEERKKQIGRLVYDLKKGALSYESTYPTLETLLNMTTNKFFEIYPAIANNNGWAKLFAYYTNGKGENAEVETGNISNIDRDSTVKEALEIIASQVDPANQHTFDAIRCAITLHYTNNEAEVARIVPVYANLPADFFNALTAAKAINISDVLQPLITGGHYDRLSSTEKELIFKHYLSDKDVQKVIIEIIQNLATSYSSLQDKKISEISELTEEKSTANYIAKFVTDYTTYMAKQINDK